MTFPGRSTVVTPGGLRKTMDELRVGDRVLSGFHRSGAPVFSEVYGFARRAPSEAVTVLDVVLAVPGRGLSISQAPPGRYVFECSGPRASCRGNGTGPWRARPARELARGSVIRFQNHGIPSVAVVRDTWASQEAGVYAPLIAGGSVYVDGVLVDGMLAAARDPHSTAALRAEAFARWALDAGAARAVLHALGPEAAQAWAAGGSLLAATGKRCTLLLAAAASLALALALMARSAHGARGSGTATGAGLAAQIAPRPSPFCSARAGTATGRQGDPFAKADGLRAPLIEPPGLITPRCSTSGAPRDFGLV